MNVGLAFKAALARVEEYEQINPRVRIRIMTRWSGTTERRTGVGFFDGGMTSTGVMVHAQLRASNNRELESQRGPGAGGVAERIIPWEELDARAHELPRLVDECVAAAAAAFAGAQN